MMPRLLKLFALLVALLCIVGFYSQQKRSFWVPAVEENVRPLTVSDVVNRYGDAARERLHKHFDSAGVAYPPSDVTLLAIKDSATLELWVGPQSNPTFIRDFPIRALSGKSGPKLREGDRQVPEGLYKISGLNPNSSYHLSMKLNYPNDFDLKHAQKEGREFPGTNIFIHGKAVSIGCLAMGDTAIEELFVMAADIGRHNIRVAVAPSDPRKAELVPVDTLPWTVELYEDLTATFSQYQN